MAAALRRLLRRALRLLLADAAERQKLQHYSSNRELLWFASFICTTPSWGLLIGPVAAVQAAAHDHDAGLLRSKGYSASGVVLTVRLRQMRKKKR